jgi:hypothetical protein
MAFRFSFSEPAIDYEKRAGAGKAEYLFGHER